MNEQLEQALDRLRRLNPDLTSLTGGKLKTQRKGNLQKVLVANRGEIARRFFFLLKEEGIPSVAVVTDVDREQSWFEFADQVIYIGNARNYADASTILAAVHLSGANAVYPGYGFLSEDFRFVEALEEYSQWIQSNIQPHTLKRPQQYTAAEALPDHAGLSQGQSPDGSLQPPSPSTAAAPLASRANTKGLSSNGTENSFATHRDEPGTTRQPDPGAFIFMGPSARTMRKVSNKLDARNLAREHGVALFEGSSILKDVDHAVQEADRIGYPVILKLDAGGGGKGMFSVFESAELPAALESARRIGHSNYGNSDCYLEKLIESPVHIEVQIFNGHAIGIRKCAVQRRNQKIIEESGDTFLDHHVRLKLLAAAEAMAHCSGYQEGGGAGTVEFLLDSRTGEFGFLEMNTRLQVEYPVTDQSLQIDLAKWQVLYYDGRETEVPYERVFRMRFSEKEHAIECRIYAEDPWNDFAPAPGRINELDLPTFNGVRCDFGFRKGDRVLPDYDPMIGKLIVRGRDRKEAISRLERALSEIYISGLVTNVDQLLAIVRHPAFVSGDYTNRLLQEYEELQSMEEGDPLQAAVFASVADFESRLRSDLEYTFQTPDLAETMDRIRSTPLPRGYRVQTGSGSLQIDLLRTEAGQYSAYINTNPFCDLKVHNRLDSLDDLLIVRDGYSCPVRIDHRAGFRTLRIMERDRRVRYYRLQVEAMGTGGQTDPPGTVRCPFAATFVQLGKDASGIALKDGSEVQKGDTIFVISAMKMECKMLADRDGRLSNVLEGGSLDRLIQGTTADGLVLGRPIAEGEVLFRVEGEQGEEGSSVFAPAIAEPDDFQGPEDLFKETGAELGASDLLRFAHTLVRGYAHDPRVVEVILENSAGLSAWNPGEVEQSILAGLVQDYATLELMFSPLIEKDQTYFGELNRLIHNWESPDYQPSLFFRSVAARMLRRYGLEVNSGRSPEKKVALYHMIRARVQFPEIRRMLVALLNSIESHRLGDELRRALLQLQKQESIATDPALGRSSRALLRREPRISPHDRRKIPQYPESKVLPDLVEPEWPAFAAEEIHRLLDLADTYSATSNKATNHPEAWNGSDEKDQSTPCFFRRMESDTPGVALYVRENRNPAEIPDGYCIVWMDGGAPLAQSSSDGTIRGIPNLERAARQASEAIRQYRGNVAWKLHILGHEHPSSLDLTSTDAASFQYENLMKVIRRLVVFYLPLPVVSVIADFLTESRPGLFRRSLFRISAFNGRARMEMVPPEDPIHPEYEADVDAKTLQLLSRGKWTPEIWARATFDEASFEEILFPTLHGGDSSGCNENGSRQQPAHRIGCRLYRGTMHGQLALFYIKDSRINGGATGNLEGQMYAASVHLAYLTDTPIYVWNDGAGANIKEGMVSLNRAAQGFFFNAITSARPDYREYRRRVEVLDDAVLKEVLQDAQTLAETGRPLSRGPRSFFLAAIGMGSSTGLDVYGSSQAPIQIMLDDPGSFRVLTGSNVIRSVTGEDLTNYEIGGAPVMGQTGTVDRIARDKTELILEIRRMHKMLLTGRSRNAMQPGLAEERSAARAGSSKGYSENDPANKDSHPIPSSEESASGQTYPTRALLEHCLGGELVSIKEEYSAAGALGAWLGRIQGQPFFILGPGQSGMRSTAAVYKARDVLRMADRLAVPVILFFGKYWYRGSWDAEDGTDRIRARMDFLRTLQSLQVDRYHMILESEGMQRVSLNQGATALVLVNREEAWPDCAHGLADFVERDVRSAMLRIADLHRVREKSHPMAPSGILNLPESASLPFDMKEVIHSLVDGGSLQIWQDSPLEPNLITATARLEGQPLAVIADQPLKGGVPDAYGTERFRQFVEKVRRWDLPLLMLSNAPGFLPGTQQERLRIQQIGGESLDVNVQSDMPVVSVVLRQNFGGRQIHAFSRFLRPGIAALALEDAIMAVMGAEASFDLFKQKEYRQLLEENRVQEARQLRSDYLNDYRQRFRADANAYETGALDEVVQLNQLRSSLQRALKLASQRAARWKGDSAGKSLDVS